MTGRGTDQILPHPGDPLIHEPYMKSAKGYVELAERASGPIQRPVDFFYIWGDALQEWDRAEEQLAAAVDSQPETPSPYLEMGKLWRAQGEYERAMSWYRDALEIQPEYVPALLELGETHLELEDCEQAVLQYLLVLEINPDNETAQNGLNVCQGE